MGKRHHQGAPSLEGLKEHPFWFETNFTGLVTCEPTTNPALPNTCMGTITIV